jgi:diguanylate cyclase (GGDEF)-like protein
MNNIISENSILIIDDSDSIRDKVKNALRLVNLFDVIREASNGIEGLKSMIDHPPDIILCDIVMPGMDGFKFLAAKNAKTRYRDIPVIMLTGEDNPKDKIKGLEQGASDYLTKPFDSGELLARVKVHLKLKKLQDELRYTNVRLEELSNTDSLTKLYNRRYFDDMIEKEFDRAVRYGGRLSFLMADIDRFKPFNDTYGHQVGDEILVSVCKIFRIGQRRHDVVARYGGEEFAFILPETSKEGAISVAERYCREIENTPFITSAGQLKVTISLGVSNYPVDGPSSTEELIKFADRAVYKAKDEGRNCVVSCGD